MTRISDCVLYFQTYFNDKKHLGATDTFVRVDEGNEKREIPSPLGCELPEGRPCLSCLNPQHLAAYSVYPVNIQKHIEGGNDWFDSNHSILFVFLNIKTVLINEVPCFARS